VSATLTPPGQERLTVVVSDPIGQQAVTLEGLTPTATAQEVVAMAMSSLRLPPNLVFNLRDNATSRLLPENQSIGDIAAKENPHVRVTMQPDAGLG